MAVLLGGSPTGRGPCPAPGHRMDRRRGL